jgi:hypothetical protein
MSALLLPVRYPFWIRNGFLARGSFRSEGLGRTDVPNRRPRVADVRSRIAYRYHRYRPHDQPTTRLKKLNGTCEVVAWVRLTNLHAFNELLLLSQRGVTFVRLEGVRRRR